MTTLQLELYADPAPIEGTEWSKPRPDAELSFYVVALVHGEPVAQLGLFKTGARAWVEDQLFVRADYRGRGLAEIVIEATLHLASKHTDFVGFRSRTTTTSVEALLRRGARYETPVDIQHADPEYIVGRRDLRTLRERVAEGATAAIELPHARELS